MTMIGAGYHRDYAEHCAPPFQARGWLPFKVRPAVGCELSSKPLKLLAVGRDGPHTPPVVRFPGQIV